MLTTNGSKTGLITNNNAQASLLPTTNGSLTRLITNNSDQAGHSTVSGEHQTGLVTIVSEQGALMFTTNGSVTVMFTNVRVLYLYLTSCYSLSHLAEVYTECNCNVVVQSKDLEFLRQTPGHIYTCEHKT
jgi:hypothetical protein